MTHHIGLFHRTDHPIFDFPLAMAIHPGSRQINLLLPFKRVRDSSNWVSGAVLRKATAIVSWRFAIGQLSNRATGSSLNQPRCAGEYYLQSRMAAAARLERIT
ncbi:MAG TPA: hypothetical protein PLV07_07130 [Acidiphilium sp.]|uniref:hypothetical protein n=1 Tax=unclassified Acidiphilium TaxID=2617493 RepID=UPI000BD8E9C1|nr:MULTISPECIES: hypothetical protein [unclassified Acidiphilium]OYV54433.1 MAG: hypothetical protein B7Z76_14500 [Acidiphilium sp. 20-67-58]HQU11340.1 hypothetical protein [Acidiphilium sp.]